VRHHDRRLAVRSLVDVEVAGVDRQAQQHPQAVVVLGDEHAPVPTPALTRRRHAPSPPTRPDRLHFGATVSGRRSVGNVTGRKCQRVN
jgi:hypothetical protein